MIIVYISGVWDLFHVGHLNAIRNARLLGDMLIAGVVTDEFCAEYKGRPPIIPFEQRRAVIEALRDVNATVPVTSFDIPPLEYRVSIRAHGPWYGKYDGQKALLRKLVDLGIEAICVPRTDGISTTQIKERIKNE
jgi:glycerol-3-phosphate cytidylyltransferase